MATVGGAPEFVACVVGLSRSEGEEFTKRQGIGKSCLCHRFVYPEPEDYIDEHQSLLALHEFTSPVINGVHFLYWGSVVKSFSTGKASDKSSRVNFHVIEQTVFYQDETSKPFSSGSKPDSLDQYLKRITGSIESPGKLSYRSRDDIESNCEKQQYPGRLSRLPRGFMVVLDVSLSGDEFEVQLQMTEQILDYLVKQKQKFVVVATKRDKCDVDSLESAFKLKRKYHSHVIETSARVNRNVHDAFRVLARTTLQKKAQGVSDSVPDYEEPELSTIKPRSNLKQALSPKHVAKRCKNSLTVEGGGRKRRRSKQLSVDNSGMEEIISNGSLHSDTELSDYPDEEGSPLYEAGDIPSDVDVGEDVLQGSGSFAAMSHDFKENQENLDGILADGALGEFKGHGIESAPVEIRLEPPAPAAVESTSPVVSDGEGGGGGRRRSGFWKDWHKIRQVKQKVFDNKKRKDRAKSPAGRHGVEKEPLLLLNED